MKIRTLTFLTGILANLLLISAVAFAQAPPPAPAAAAPPPAHEYSGSFGGGLTLTGGNTDTSSYNLSFSHIHPRKNGNTDKITGSYIHGSQNDVLTVARGTASFRDEYKLAKRVFVFGEVDYLSDRFKDISYWIAPFGGLGYLLSDTDQLKLQVSGGGGGVWEKNSGIDVQRSGSVNGGQDLNWKVTDRSTVTESFGTVWKTDDLSNYLSNFSVGLTTSIVKQLELKVEFQDSYKSIPPKVTIKKNDTAFVLTFLLKY